VTEFKPLVHQEDAEYVLVSRIADLKKIEARGVKHSHTGEGLYTYVMIEMLFMNGQLQCKSLENNSLLLK